MKEKREWNRIGRRTIFEIFQLSLTYLCPLLVALVEEFQVPVFKLFLQNTQTVKIFLPRGILRWTKVYGKNNLVGNCR